MWKSEKKAPVGLYLLCVAALSVVTNLLLHLLTPWSVAYAETGKMTLGYLCYAAIGLLFSTPTPFLAAAFVILRREKIGVREFLARIFRTECPAFAAVLTAAFCLLALIYALLEGQRNDAPWYMLPLGLIVMIPFVGIAEETGWRGLLQPALEKRLHFPFSTLLTAAIWCVWHVELWFDPTSRHYGDSFLGFALAILVWAFALAALYKATKSVFACAVYHAFVDALGAVYDWNALFDAFPGNGAANLYRIVLLLASAALWLAADRRERKAERPG